MKLTPLYIVFVILFASLPAHILFAEKQDSTLLSFYWSFLQCNKQGEIGILDFEQKIPHPEDSLFKIFLQPEENVYLYLFHYSHEKELTLLFPAPHSFFNQDYRLGQGYYIPGDADQWFGLEARAGFQSRKEKFYLLASTSRLLELEAVTREYLLCFENQADPRPDINRYKQQVLNRITALKNSNSIFSTWTEIPVMLTTQFRGQSEKWESQVIQVQAENFYARTISLEY